MGLFSVAKLFGMTIRESATDGSDFTNPDADYRRLFLGEDGGLHLKDSAGTVTDVAGSGAVATDAIWDAAGDLAVGSGANTAARLAIGAAGGALAVVNSAVAWNSGTSFPANKATGDRYWRTDLGLEFYWDGTRWVTTQLFSTPLVLRDDPSFPYTATATPLLSCRDGRLNGMFITTWRVDTTVATTNEATKYWTGQLVSYTAADAPTNVGSSFSTATDGVSTHVLHSVTVDAVLAATEFLLAVTFTKVSTPGGLYPSGATVDYRLIAT